MGNLIKKLTHNNVVLYLTSRYLTYGLQFITSLVIAAKLGPFYMGVWGFLMLVLNYFGQINFGISNSFNILYVHNKESKIECDKYIANSLFILIYISLAVIVMYALYKVCGFGLFDKYNVDKYVVYLFIIAILQYFQQFVITLFRVKNKISYVTICQSVIVVLNFACIFFFDGETLILLLLLGYLLGYLVAVVLAINDKYIPKSWFRYISFNHQKQIIKKGLLLFLYNTCFYFIIISIRTIISGNYEVEEFGLFTFSFTLAHAIMLLLDSMSFIIFPKLVSKLSSSSKDEVMKTIDSFRIAYISSSHFLIYIALLFFPILLSFFPKYSNALLSMNLIALSILMNACSAGYSTLLISRNKEKISALLSIFALVVNITIAYILVHSFNVEFSYVILATLITYFFFSLAVTYFGGKTLGDYSIITAIKNFFPWRLIIPYTIALVVCVFKFEVAIFLPLVAYIVFNYKDIKKLINITKRIINEPSMVNL